MQLHALEPLLKVFYVFIYKFSFPADKNFPRKISDKYMENLKQASFWTTCLEKFKRSYVPPKTHVSKILCCVALAVYKSYFFSEQPFYGNYLTFHILAIIWDQYALFVSYWLANQQWFFNTPMIGFGSFYYQCFIEEVQKYDWLWQQIFHRIWRL